MWQWADFWARGHGKFIMTSSNGNIFRVTGPLCREFTGPGEFPAQRSVTRSFDVFFDLRMNKRLSKQPWGWWFEMPAWSLWHQRNVQAITQRKINIHLSQHIEAVTKRHQFCRLHFICIFPVVFSFKLHRSLNEFRKSQINACIASWSVCLGPRLEHHT